MQRSLLAHLLFVAESKEAGFRVEQASGPAPAADDNINEADASDKASAARNASWAAEERNSSQQTAFDCLERTSVAVRKPLEQRIII